MNILTRTALLLALLIGFSAAGAEPAHDAISIYSDGIRLAGDLWKPEGLRQGEKRPGILMIHGWGGTKSHLNQVYAPQFVELGYVVLTFDFTGWGESEGVVIRTGARPEFKPDAPAPEYATTVREIRQIVNPLEEMDDVRAAFAYLVTDPSVDPDRIAVWGTSLGGGLSLAAAIEFPQIKVMMTQVGAVNPRAGFESTPADSPLAPDNMTRWRGAIARGTAPSFPSEATPGLQGFPDMPDFVRYDPYRNLDQLRAASLIIEAADEELMDIKKNGVDLYQRIKDKVPARYEVVQGTHYDVYRGDGYQKALGLQKAWLAQHLPVK